MCVIFKLHWPGISTMETCLLVLLFGILHSIQSHCDAKMIRDVEVPHSAPAGYEVTKLIHVEAPHIIESYNGDTQKLFTVQENGAVVTKDKLESFAGTSQILVVKNGINGKVLESLHINIAQSLQNGLVFQQGRYIGTIRENENVGSIVKIIGHLSVVGCNNVTYSLLNGSESFSVRTVFFGSTHDNIITSSKSFNREFQGLYHITLEGVCSSGGSTSANIEIHILDKNDIIPKFRSSVQTVQASPDQSWGKITTVLAYDWDQNEHITYSLQDSSEFYIDPDSGEIYSENDYLCPGSYSVTVFAIDSVGHISKPLTLYIAVEDDSLKFKPRQSIGHRLTKRATLTIKRQFDIVENSSISTALFSITSVQPRPQAERYRQVSASVDLFQEPDYNGQVYLKPGKKLDYEDTSQRQIVLVYNRTNLNTPEGKYIAQFLDI